MEKEINKLKFQKDMASYEQNFITFRSLNNLMWQVPLISMTLTGGLWFGVTKVGDFFWFKSALLFLAAIGNLGLVVALHRLRFLIGEYLKWIENYNRDGFVPGDGKWLSRPYAIRISFQLIILTAAIISIFLFVQMMIYRDDELMSESETNIISYYNQFAKNLADNYEGISTEDAHPHLVEAVRALKNAKFDALDIGSGSGRDSAWMAAQGARVVAVEPSEGMRKIAISRHRDENIQWINDSLPELNTIAKLGRKFDIVLLSAVWMHVSQENRENSFQNILKVLKEDGKIFMTIRVGTVSEENEGFYDVSIEEIYRMVKGNNLVVDDYGISPDLLNRENVVWRRLKISKR